MNDKLRQLIRDVHAAVTANPEQYRHLMLPDGPAVSVDLLPCPFCGDQACLRPWQATGDLLEGESEEDASWVIWCGWCGVDGPPASTPDEAAERWNDRK